MRVRISATARIDLDQIADWIAQDHPAAAVRLVAKLRNRCFSLARYPNRFKTLRRGSPFRMSPCDNYAIFYQVMADEVEIVRILHSARDRAAIFGLEEP